jgi:DNA helicase-2/ATP-dependent DNA helicase PcrA
MSRSDLTRADAVLEALDPEQREVATALSGPVCVLAGAGTGKTRAITHRIAYGVHSGVYVPHQVLAVTFTARAAGEMRTRLRDLGVGGVQARTFHAAALRQLGYFWPRTIGGAPPSLIEHKASLVADAAARLRISVDRPAVRDLAAEVEWAKVSLLTPETYLASATGAGRGQPGGFDLATVARLLEVYEQAKTDRGVIDFEDVLLLTGGILAEYPDVAAAVRAQYRHFVVDEYQDVSALQQRLLDAWTGDRDDLCVVGDPNQTIYSFTGASPEYLTGFRRRHPTARLVRLVRDYRSTPQVVALANALADRPRGRGEGMRLVAQRAGGPVPTLTAYEDDLAEAAGVARAAAALVGRGVPVAEIAVLYRTNAQSEALEQAMAEAGLPYLVRGGERFFARKEVREAVLLLRGAARAGAADGAAAAPMPTQVRDVLASAGWTSHPPSGGGAVRDRWESLQALAALADALAAADPQATLAALVTELEERAAVQHAPTVQGVTLASLHAAKGLEWDAVFLVGLSDGLVPISLAEGWEEIAEERRLLYVGVTRAREHLALSWARARTPGGRASRSPSRFLDGEGVAAALAGAAGAATPSGSGVRRGPGPRSRATAALPTACRACAAALDTAAERKIGRCSSCPPTYDEAVFEHLRGWRAARAAEANVPAYAVFTDATLVAIAESMPREVEELARLPGVGPAKLARYGAEVLAVLAAGAGG